MPGFTLMRKGIAATVACRAAILIVTAALASYNQARAQVKADTLWDIRHKAGHLEGADADISPALLPKLAFPAFTSVEFAGSAYGGRFKRPQEEQRGRTLGFGACGIAKSRGWTVWGNFNYTKVYRDSIKFSNVANAYDGNPFITGDSVGGNWSGDRLAAGVVAAAPRLGKWQLACAVKYEAGQNARKSDPRPLNRVLNYEIKPSVGFEINAGQVVAVSGSYSYGSETVETGYYADEVPPIYSIRGYGTYSVGPVVTAQRFTNGYGFTGQADYYLRRRNLLMAGLKITYRTRDVNDGVARPVFIGGFDERGGEITAGFTTNAQAERGWTGRARGWYKDGIGYDPVFKAVNPAYYFSGAEGVVSYWKKNKNNKFLVALSLYPAVQYANLYESVAKTNGTTCILSNVAGIALRTSVKGITFFAAEIKGGYHANLKREFVANRPGLLTSLTVRPYFDYLGADYMSGSGEVEAAVKNGTLTWRVALGGDVAHSVMLGNRSAGHISVGLIF